MSDDAAQNRLTARQAGNGQVTASCNRLLNHRPVLLFLSISLRIGAFRCESTARRVLALPCHRYSTLLLSIPFRCQSQRVLSFSILVPATPVLSVSPRVEAPRTYHIPLGSAPFNTLLFLSISQLCRSYPWCRICVYGSRGQSSLATSSHSKRPLPLLRHWNRPRRAP